MKVITATLEEHKICMEIEVPQEEVKKAFDRAYKKLAARVNIPGFRKGKAPRKVLEMHLGKEALKEEALDFLVNENYGKALDEEKIDPVTRPEIDLVSFEEGQDMTFKATFTKKPEVTLGAYKEIAAEKESPNVSDEDVDKQLENLRNRQAKMVIAEDRELADGDFAIIDFEGSVDGELFPGGKGAGYPLEIGSGSFIPGFEEQLIGAKAGDERIVQVTFPAEYQEASLAGKNAEFKVKINDVKCKELPNLDDEFAKDVSKFATLDEYKADLKEQMQKAALERAEHEHANKVVQTAVDNATVDVPSIMVDQRVAQMIQELQNNLEGRGMNLDLYLKYTKMDLEKLKEDYRQPALENVKTDLVLEAVAKEEKMEVSPEELNAEVVGMAHNFGANPKDVWDIIRKEGRVMSLVETVVRRKAARFIVEQATKAE